MRPRAERDPDKARDEARELSTGFDPDRRENAARDRRRIIDAEERLAAILMLPETWVY